MTSPIRVLRQFVNGGGKHRPRRVVLLPDVPPVPAAEPITGTVLDEDTLEVLLDGGDVVANESAPCPTCKRTTYQALHRDGSRCCWTCGVTTLAGAA